MSIHRLARAAFVAVVLLILPAAASAQQAGVKAGVNFASLTDAEDEFPNTSRRPGLIAGVWVRTPATDRFSFQVEGLFSEKGLRFEVEEQGFSASGDIRIRYIEVPLLGRADFGTAGSPARFFAVAGAAPAFKLSGRVKGEFEGEEATQDIGDDLESFDLGLVGGFGVEFGRATLEARYTYGLTSIAKDDEDTGESVKNRVFSVTIGFRFR